MEVNYLKIKIQNELIIIDLLVLLILGVNFIPYNAIRIVLGLPFILFFSGYTIIAALFPKKTGMDWLERVALSFSARIAIVTLVGLPLNYTFVPVLYSVSLFIVVTSIAAWLRQRRLPVQEIFIIEFELGDLE